MGDRAGAAVVLSARISGAELDYFQSGQIDKILQWVLDNKVILPLKANYFINETYTKAGVASQLTDKSLQGCH